jgi:23S rRNA pseudouridine1911/1915/1917 synthase
MPPGLSETPTDIEVRPRADGARLDAYLTTRFPDFSRSVIQKVIDAGAVLVNGKPGRASYKVKGGDQIRVWLPDIGDGTPTPEDIPLTILHEDPGFVVVNKPPGMIVHPARGNWRGTLVNALQFHFDRLSTVSGTHRPGVIHRLDRDTSGLILVGKDDRAHTLLARQFEDRLVEKTYLALVYGVPTKDRDYIEKPIGFHPTYREKMAIRPLQEGAREAVTFYEVLERYRAHALVRCHPKTGRTHQIRVHMTHIGHPILADKLYSGRDRFTLAEITGGVADGETVLIDRQALHAHSLRFTHPETGRELSFTAEPPEDVARTLQALRTRVSETKGSPRAQHVIK